MLTISFAKLDLWLLKNLKANYLKKRLAYSFYHGKENIISEICGYPLFASLYFNIIIEKRLTVYKTHFVRL